MFEDLDLELLELADFEGLIDQTFVFSPEGGGDRFEAVLQKAEPIASDTATGIERQPFVLEFKFPPGAGLDQCVLAAETQGGKSFPPMLLVPRGADKDGWYMDALFN